MDPMHDEAKAHRAGAKTVAEWMLATLRASDDAELHHADAHAGIELTFGSAFVSVDSHRYPTIDRHVLREFRELTGNDVVWVIPNGDFTSGFWR
jgi:hypothetical protein